MPNYNLASPKAIALYPGYPCNLGLAFSAESPAVNQASQEFHIPPAPWASPSISLTSELFFSGAPGTFEIDIQEADTDTDAAYIVLATAGTITTVNANNYARVDLSPFVGKFVRLFIKTAIQNPVTLTAKISRN